MKINQIINPRFVYENSQIRGFFEGIEEKFQVDGLDLLIIWILHESKNDSSKYKPYFNALPSKFSVPYTNLSQLLVENLLREHSAKFWLVAMEPIFYNKSNSIFDISKKKVILCFF